MGCEETQIGGSSLYLLGQVPRGGATVRSGGTLVCPYRLYGMCGCDRGARRDGNEPRSLSASPDSFCACAPQSPCECGPILGGQRDVGSELGRGRAGAPR